MIDIVNLVAALLTIAFGAFGFLAPRFTAAALDLQTGETTMGLSEMRASVGGLFVALAGGAILLGSGALYAALGVAYLGAAAGRGLSIVLDGAPRRKAGIYFAIEAVLAVWLIAANMGALA